MTTTCPGCGAELPEGTTCQDAFHQMLFWESEDSSLGEVHHLMVSSYHVQHPRLLSPEGLREMIIGLRDFVNGVSPAERRRQIRDEVNAANRKWKIASTADNFANYEHPVVWPIKAQDIVAHGMENYRESVREWAASIIVTLQATGNMPTT